MLGASYNAPTNIVINAKIKKNFSRVGYTCLYKKRSYYYSDIATNAAAPYSSLTKQQFLTPPCRCYDGDDEDYGLDSLNLFLPRRVGNGSPSGRRRGARVGGAAKRGS
jgi:hypothetical protein